MNREPPAPARPVSAADLSVTQVSADADVARSAGRGGLAVAAAKIYFILTGLIQQVALKAVLGLQGYGDISTVLSATSISYNPIVSTSIQGVSRAVASSDPVNQPAAQRRTISIHVAMALVAASAFFFGAPAIGRVMGAPHVVPALQILSLVLVLYGIYTPLVGVLNGKKRFFSQAGLDAFAATLRTCGLIGGAYLLSRGASDSMAGVVGASWGFVGGAVIVLGVALSMVGFGRRGPGGPTLKAHLKFIVPLLGGQILLNVLFQADALLLRRFASDAALLAFNDVEGAGELVGAYRAAQLFCFLPYQLLLAITFILFPLLARAHHQGDRHAVASYVQNGMRLAMVIGGALVSVNGGLHGQLINLVFGADAATLGGGAMQLLAIGLGSFAIFGILTSVLNSLGRERASAGVTMLAMIFVGGACLTTVPGTAYGPEILQKTALSTSLGLIGATLLAALLVYQTVGALMPLRSFARIVLAASVALVVGRLLPPQGKLMVIVYAALVGLVYLGVLIVTRELGKDDLKVFRRVVGR